MEGAPCRGGEASRARRRAGRFDARPLLDLDAHPRQPAARPREAAAGSGTFGSGRKHFFELVGAGDLELIVATLLCRLVGPPAQEDRRVAKALALEMVVLHLAHPLDAQRLPGEILAGAPAALRPW